MPILDSVFLAMDNRGVRICENTYIEICRASDNILERFECLAEQKVLIQVNIYTPDMCIVSMQRLSEYYGTYSDAIDSQESAESDWERYFFSYESDAMRAVLDFLSGMIVID